jgi:CDP-paratose 2-epimerase
MSVAIVSGSAGLVGSAASRRFAERGLEIVGVDNDMRRTFFGDIASTRQTRAALEQELGDRYRHEFLDIRDAAAIDRLFRHHGKSVELVVHTAAQPSHDWSALDPTTDFEVNANGTLNLLEGLRKHSPDAVFIFTSTNKVYGDRPNALPLIELDRRFELAEDHPYHNGISEDMPVDRCLHSPFGASKLAADVVVQEFGRYFGIRTACFRGGCLTGPEHAGAELHGFLAYLMKCTVLGRPYTVYGYDGKQVRDNIHSSDLSRAFEQFFSEPKCGEVYNIGGGRFSNCSMLEAIELCEEIAGRELEYSYTDRHRIGDHKWWISDNGRFSSHYPEWSLTYDVPAILREIYEALVSRNAD